MSTANIPTLFALPTAPEQFSVLLPPATLRKLDFTALDFPTARKAVIEYIQTYFPDNFNDFVSNDGIIMLAEMCSFLVAALSLREDVLSEEGFFPTCQTLNAAINHMALIDQGLQWQTPASTNIQCMLSSPLVSDLHISPGSLQPFTVKGADGTNIYYELFSAPDDLTSDIIIPAGKQGVMAFGLEGQTQKSQFVVDGLANTTLAINGTNILSAPISVLVQLNAADSGTEWSEVDILQDAGATDQVFEVRLLNNLLEIVFGDNITGQIPLGNSIITVSYRIGGGTRGQIGAGAINSQQSIQPQYPYTAAVMVTFNNPLASTGGTDVESLDHAKLRAPRDFATHDSAVTETDYAQLAGSFSHPVFGAVAKAVATVRTGLNANLVEIYVLAQGTNGVPVQPSQGLKQALATYLDEINVITDSVVVLGGCIRPVDVTMNVIMSKNADASITKTQVEAAVASFFALDNWDMGQALYISNLIELINHIDGVAYIDLFNPSDNVLPSGQLCNQSGASGTDVTEGMVGINEVITLGDLQIAYFYQPSGH